MDRALIERMVGATVLVLLLVIVAPALLDGSRPEPAPDGDSESGDRMRTEVILLTESAARSSRRESSDQATAAASPPRPEAPADPEPVSQKRPEPAAAPELKSSAAAAPQVSAVPEAAGDYAVQLGSFRERANASQLADKIKRQGFPVFVQSAASSAGTIYRVYAGPRPTREAAEKLTATLAKAGYDGMVIDMSTN